MNWVLFAICAWLTLGLELALRDLLQLGPSGVAPSFMLPLAIYVALWAPARAAVGACFVLGLLVDLTGPRMIGQTPKVFAGPHALGYMLACALVLNMRGAIMRRNPISLIVLTVLGGAISTIVVVSLHTIRHIYDPFVWDATGELLSGLAGALYSGASAAVMSLPLFALLPFFSFPAGMHGSRASVHRA